MKRYLAFMTGTALTLLLAACGDGGGGGGNPLDDSGGSGDAIVVGSANFSENALLGEVYAQALEAQGFDVSRKPNIGSREVLFAQIKSCGLSVVPEYTQALLSYAAPEVTAVGPDEVNAALETALPDTTGFLTPSPARDDNAVAVTAETASEHGLETLEDLAPVADQLTMGGPTEFQTRKDGLVGMKSEYGVEFANYKVLGDNSGPITVSALADGNVDVALFQTSSPSLAENDFKVLADPKSVLGINNVTPFYCKEGLNEDAQAVLDDVSSTMTTEALMDMNYAYSVDKEDADQVAQDWLSTNGLN